MMHVMSFHHRFLLNNLVSCWPTSDTVYFHYPLIRALSSQKIKNHLVCVRSQVLETISSVGWIISWILNPHRDFGGCSCILPFSARSLNLSSRFIVV